MVEVGGECMWGSIGNWFGYRLFSLEGLADLAGHGGADSLADVFGCGWKGVGVVVGDRPGLFFYWKHRNIITNP